MDDVPYTLSLVTAPAAEAVTIDDLRGFLRIDDCDEAEILQRAVNAATTAVQDRCGVQLITATYDMKFLDFCRSTIVMPRLPLQSISSVKVTDDDGSQATVSTSVYLTDLGSADRRGRIVLASGQSWPTTSRAMLHGDVAVRFVAGFGDAATDVPDSYTQQILLIAANLYETRHPVCCGGGGGVVPLTMDLLDGLNMVAEFR